MHKSKEALLTIMQDSRYKPRLSQVWKDHFKKRGNVALMHSVMIIDNTVL